MADKPKVHKLHLSLSAEEIDAMETLKSRLLASSYVEVIRRALASADATGWPPVTEPGGEQSHFEAWLALDHAEKAVLDERKAATGATFRQSVIEAVVGMNALLDERDVLVAGNGGRLPKAEAARFFSTF